MKGAWLFVVGAACGAVAMAIPRVATHLHAVLHGAHGGNNSSGQARVHTEEKFVFTANGPMSEVALLFGADKERVWAPEWNPQFVQPVPAADQEGMVFTVKHDHLRAAWVNTAFDPKTGRMQYVYMIPDALVTVITIQLTPKGNQTQVDVEYARTALSVEADAHVRQMADGDRGSGPEWEKQINGYLGNVSNRR